MRSSSVAGVVMVASFGWGALASAAEPIGVGSRVDIAGIGVVPDRPGQEATAGRVRGRVLAADADTLLVERASGGTLRYRWSEVRLLRTSQGERSPLAGGKRGFVRGMGIGALVGALGGLVISSGGCSSSDFICFNPTDTIPATTAYGAAWGAGAGFVFGAMFPGERWSEVGRGRARVSVAPSTGPRGRGAGLTVSVGF